MRFFGMDLALILRKSEKRKKKFNCFHEKKLIIMVRKSLLTIRSRYLLDS